MPMQMENDNKQMLLNAINTDLAFEYAAAIQYFQHAATISGIYSAFVSGLLEHGDEEISHAKKLNDLINFHGGIPLVAVETRFMEAEAVPMLFQDLAGELDAMARYKAHIAMARECNEPGIELVLQEILVDEEDHANFLRTVLNK